MIRAVLFAAALLVLAACETIEVEDETATALAVCEAQLEHRQQCVDELRGSVKHWVDQYGRKRTTKNVGCIADRDKYHRDLQVCRTELDMERRRTKTTVVERTTTENSKTVEEVD